MLVSPDGPLGQIPLAALPGKEPNSYLIEERSIAVVPVPRMLGSAAIDRREGPGTARAGRAGSRRCSWPATSITAATRARAMSRRRAGRPQSVAGPEHSPSFPRLPATGDEIAAIGRYFRSRFPGAAAMELEGDGPPRRPSVARRRGIGSSTWPRTAISPRGSSARHSGRTTSQAARAGSRRPGRRRGRRLSSRTALGHRPGRRQPPAHAHRPGRRHPDGAGGRRIGPLGRRAGRAVGLRDRAGRGGRRRGTSRPAVGLPGGGSQDGGRIAVVGQHGRLAC